MVKIDRTEVVKATKASQMPNNLLNDRITIMVAMFAAIVTAGLLVYQSLDKDRLEMVFLTEDKIDIPTLLPKISDNKDAVKTDRWVRGFARRVIGYYFLSPSDSPEFAKKAIAWLHAHSSAMGQKRSEAFFADLEKFEQVRHQKFALFFPINDPSTIKIRPSDDSNGTYYVEIPGTYNTTNVEGESIFPAKLKLVIEQTSISGFPSSLGAINTSGLKLINGTIEFNEDLVKENSITRVALFKNSDN